MTNITKNNLEINSLLFNFINNEVIPGTDIKEEHFWNNFSQAVHELEPINKNLIKKREDIQKKINNWHKEKKGKNFNQVEYTTFLKLIGYIVEEKENFHIATVNVDKEITSIAGPQLVVPVDNARYALNAANARWGSLYDALYGTDIIPGEKGKDYDAQRGSKVIDYVRSFLTKIAPLDSGSCKEITEVRIEEKNLVLIVDDKKQFLKNKNQFLGFSGNKEVLNQY